MRLSVVVPAYNEAERLGPHLGPVLAFLGGHYPDYELIVVDDGSQDETAARVAAALAGEPRARLISYRPNRGKGYAVRTGVLASSGDVVVFMDADLSTPLDEIPRLLERLAAADVVIGSRGLPEAEIHVRPPLHRRAASWIFDQIKYALVGLRAFQDTQCGFKGFRGPLARQLFALGRVDRFMFDVEILFLAERAGLRIVEMPVAWADRPGSKVRFWEGVVNMFRDLGRIRRLHPGRVVLDSAAAPTPPAGRAGH
ncbi:MAG: glycosyltransferase family 2 protein [Anaerolineales bacterium]|nr:glycosyltransferase family 2 protein [Anaerolineales bacterium]